MVKLDDKPSGEVPGLGQSEQNNSPVLERSRLLIYKYVCSHGKDGDVHSTVISNHDHLQQQGIAVYGLIQHL